jgi:hypothetical protein
MPTKDTKFTKKQSAFALTFVDFVLFVGSQMVGAEGVTGTLVVAGSSASSSCCSASVGAW